MRRLVMAFALMLMAARGWGQDAAAAPADPMALVAWMAGNWTAQASEPGSSKPPSKIESHYLPVLGGKGMSIDTSFEGKPEYHGMFGYDGARKAVAFWYVTAGSESVAGTVMPGTGYLLLDFMLTKADGEAHHLQTHITQVDADHYKWELYADPQGTGFVKLFDLMYSRVK